MTSSKTSSAPVARRALAQQVEEALGAAGRGPCWPGYGSARIAANSCSSVAARDAPPGRSRARSPCPRPAPPVTPGRRPGCPAWRGPSRPRRAGRRRGRGRRRRTSGASRARSPRAPGGSRSSSPRSPRTSCAPSRPTGTRPTTSSARSTSPSVGAPNVVPRSAAAVTAATTVGVRVPEDQRPPRAARSRRSGCRRRRSISAPCAALDEERVAADRAASRAPASSRRRGGPLGAREELGGAGVA